MAVQGHYPIERFDPLLRDLVGWGLVERRETKTRTTWQLVADAQRRLDELASPAPGPATGADFYFGRLCADCHPARPLPGSTGTATCATHAGPSAKQGCMSWSRNRLHLRRRRISGAEVDLGKRPL